MESKKVDLVRQATIAQVRKFQRVGVLMDRMQEALRKKGCKCHLEIGDSPCPIHDCPVCGGEHNCPKCLGISSDEVSK